MNKYYYVVFENRDDRNWTTMITVTAKHPFQTLKSMNAEEGETVLTFWRLIDIEEYNLFKELFEKDGI